MAFPKFVPAELLVDVFGFLNRNEVEKAQLVNKNWENVVETHGNVLAVRQMFSLQVDSNAASEYEKVEPFSPVLMIHEDDGFPPEPLDEYRKNVKKIQGIFGDNKIMIRNLQYVVFDQINISPMYYHDSDATKKAIGLLMGITKIMGRKIRVGIIYPHTMEEEKDLKNNLEIVKK